MSNYPWQAIDPKDFISIESEHNLTMQDVRILTKLYKPIIGGDAYSFYQSLFSELDFRAQKKMVSVSKLLTKLNIGIRDFYHARIRLEGLGLLENYRSKTKENEYIYVLKKPLSTNEFLGDSLLQALLMEQIGKTNFQEEVNDLVSKFQTKENYEDLTRSFTDVYHFDLEKSEVRQTIDGVQSESKDLIKPVETIENIDSFDYSFFKKGLNKHFVRQDSLTKEIKELIYTYHIIYGIDELAMQNIILESADVESGKVEGNKLTHTVQRMYLNKQKRKKTAQIKENELIPLTGSLDESEKTNLTKEGFTPSEISVIHHAKNTPPGRYLKSIKDQRNGFVTSNESWLLKELVEQSPLSKEVINILLHYILVIQKSVVLDKNYATKIANDWAQSDVKTAEDAVVKLRNMFNESREKGKNQQSSNRKTSYRSNYRRKAKKENLPDWAKDQNKKENEEENQLVSSQEEDTLKIRLDRIRKQRELKEDS